MNVAGAKVVAKAQVESTGGQPDDVVRKRADDAARRGIHQKNIPLLNMMTHHVYMIIFNTWYNFLLTWNKSSCQPGSKFMLRLNNDVHIICIWNYHVDMYMNMISCVHDIVHVNLEPRSCSDCQIMSVWHTDSFISFAFSSRFLDL